MTDAAIAIPNLLYLYADLIDAGDFRGAARLFRHGGLVSGEQRLRGEDVIAGMWEGWVQLYDGSPRTRHLVTNPIIELAADGQTATCRSQWTVLQAVPGLPLQPVATGRYHDRFARIDGEWAFTERQYARVDLLGDTSRHVLQPMTEGNS